MKSVKAVLLSCVGAILLCCVPKVVLYEID